MKVLDSARGLSSGCLSRAVSRCWESWHSSSGNSLGSVGRPPTMTVSDVNDAVLAIHLIYNVSPQARSSGQTSTAKTTFLDRMTRLSLRPFLTLPLFVPKVSEARTAMGDWALRSLRSISMLPTHMQSHHFPI